MATVCSEQGKYSRAEEQKLFQLFYKISCMPSFPNFNPEDEGNMFVEKWY